MTTQHFLIPLDFSESSQQALEYAIKLAHQLQARLTLLHVVYLPPMVEVDLSTQLLEIDTAARRSIETCCQRVQQAGLAGQTVVVQGVPWQEIVQHAKDLQADLIIMGTHGRTGLQHMLLGSIAEKVVRLAPCSVLVTRPAK
jgi:nucleotide-binding universal stress UspA family protein